VVASGSQDIISQSDGLPPADTHLQQTKKRSHPMHTYKCPTDRKKTKSSDMVNVAAWRRFGECWYAAFVQSSSTHQHTCPLGNCVNVVVLLQISETSDKVKKICILFLLLLFFEPFLLTV
jgi:hypothetical protein